MAINSQDLDIDLSRKTESQTFKWFLACLLFGRPIQQEVAARTYHVLVKDGYVTADKILEADWQELVDELGKGHYVRYDESTATKLHTIMKRLKRDYGGKVTKLIGSARSPSDVKRSLQQIKGIGPKTADIFIRDVGPIWF